MAERPEVNYGAIAVYRGPALRRWIPDARQDFRYAWRALLKSPGFAIVAVFTLGLGIGANTAVFSLIKGALLRPLPYQDPDRLIVVWDKAVRERELAQIFASYRDYQEFDRHARSFERVAAATWATGGRVLTGHGAARGVLAIPVTAGFFAMLGVPPERGRTFTAEDLTRGCSLVLSDRFWRTTLGGAPDAIGTHLTLDRQTCTVLGVMPPQFAFYPAAADMWMLMSAGFKPPLEHLPVGVFARLRPGISLARAQSELTALHAALHRNEGWYEHDITPVVYNLQDEFTFLAGRNLRTTLWVLFSAVALVLFIACVNLATLLLGRSFTRQREMAIRAALGGSHGRLLRQQLAEGLLLSACGGVAGILAANAAIRYFNTVVPIELPIGAKIGISIPVLVFTAALSIVTAVLFGLLPAWKASRVDLHESMKAAGRAAAPGRGQQQLARVLLTSQMALSVILLTAAGLLAGSVLRMGSEPLGYRPEGVLAASVHLPAGRYPDEKSRTRFYQDAIRRLEALPGVAGAALSSSLPPDGGPSVAVEVQGQEEGRESPVHDVGHQEVSPAYFRVMETPLRSGRWFDARDRRDSEPVAVVSESLVARFFGHADPLGQHIRIAEPEKQHPWLTIVGVVMDQKHTSVLHEMKWISSAVVFQPLTQDTGSNVSVVVRVRGDQASIGPAIAREINGMDRDLPVGVEPLAQSITRFLAYPRFRAALFGIFAAFALLLAAMGLHGLLQQYVSQRTREIGVRMAVGARKHDILRLVAVQGGLPVMGGLAVGVAASMGMSRYLSGLLYEVRPAQPLTFMTMALPLIAVALLAMSLPARRAAAVDPAIALREE